MDGTELALLKAARAGDPQAIDRLLTRHERQVYRFGLRMCGDEEAARDVLQETLLAAFRGLPGFRGDASLSTWLFQIARSFCVKSRRRTAGEPAQFTTLASDEARAVLAPEDVDRDAHVRELGAAIQAGLLALPEAYREAVVLRDVEGLSAEEAAKVLGVEVGALKSRLHRGRMELRQHLSSLLESPQPGERPACRALIGELSAYAAAEIDQATCARIEQHLRECPSCAGACEALGRTVSLCRRIPGDDVPAPVRRAVRQALIAAVGESSARPSGSHVERRQP